MPTEEPIIDLTHPLTQALLERFRELIRSSGSLDECDEEIGRVYNEEFKMPYVCALMADVVSGRWGLGDTQEAVSERLGLIRDRSWVSRALRQGRLTLDIYLRLRMWPQRPVDWEPNVVKLQMDMRRCGFMAVARYFAGLITSRPALVPQRLTELNYELLCELFARFEEWMVRGVRRDRAYALQLVRDVCRDPRRHVVPYWLADKKYREAVAEVDRLCGDAAAALDHLLALQRNWCDIIVGTFDAVSGVK